MENVCGVVLPKIGAEGEAGLLLMAASAKWITGAIPFCIFCSKCSYFIPQRYLEKV